MNDALTLRAAMMRVIREQPEDCLRHLCAADREAWIIHATTSDCDDVAHEVAAAVLAEWDAGIIVAGQMTLPLE